MRNENLELTQSSSGSESSPSWAAGVSATTATPKASTFNFEFSNQQNQPGAPVTASTVENLTAQFKATLRTSQSNDDLPQTPAAPDKLTRREDHVSGSATSDKNSSVGGESIPDEGGGTTGDLSPPPTPDVFTAEVERHSPTLRCHSSGATLYPATSSKSKSFSYDYYHGGDGGGESTGSGDYETSTSSVGGVGGMRMTGHLSAAGDSSNKRVGGKESKIARFLRRTQSANEDTSYHTPTTKLTPGAVIGENSKGEGDGARTHKSTSPHCSSSQLYNIQPTSPRRGQKVGDDNASSSTGTGEDGRGCGVAAAARSKRHKFANVGTDMKFRLGFLKRRHTEGTIHSASVRPPPEEAQKWAISFNDLMNSKYGQALFKAFLQREFSEENIEFWLAIEDYRKSRQTKLGTKAQKIYNDFIIPQAPKEVNLDTLTKDSLVTKMAQPTHTTFDQAQKRIQGVLEADAYSRFLKSDLYLELVHPERYQQDLFISSKEQDVHS